MRLLSKGLFLKRILVFLGPLYIKAGQILATHSNLFDKETLEQIRSLQDDVGPSSEKYIRKVLTKAYGQPVEKTFSAFSFKPVASASIAQVHEAVLVTGERVAVKIVKKNVIPRLEHGIRLTGFLLKTLHWSLPRLRALDLPSHFAELAPLLEQQTDMTIEASHQRQIRADFCGHPYIRIPRPITGLCRREILVMEFVDGIRGKHFDQVALSPSRLAARLQDAFYTMVYLHGFFHADPHPGNIFFHANGEIVFLDFGLTGKLSEDEKWALSSFFHACLRQEWEHAVERFTRHFVTRKEALQNGESYREELRAVLRSHFGLKTNRWSTVHFVHDANKVVRARGGRLTSSFTRVAIAFLTGEAFVSEIDPAIDIWENARKFTDRVSPYISPPAREAFDECFREMMPGSLRARDEAGRFFVGPLHFDRFLVGSLYPLVVQRAEGSTIQDVDGNTFIDLSCGYGPHILGYGHPAIREALIRAVNAGGVNAIGNTAELELAEMLSAAFGPDCKVIFSNSGTESVLIAIRLCRAYRNRSTVAKFEGHYHGFSDQGMVSSWFRFAGPRDAPAPIQGTIGSHADAVTSTLVLQYGEMSSIQRLADKAEEIACVVCEPMPTIRADFDRLFLEALRETCSRLDIPLVFDEVVTGFRVCYGGVQTLCGIQPDLTCLAKIIGGGLPCGAVVGRSYLMNLAKTSGDPFTDVDTKVFAGGTMSGNSLSCAAGVAALRHLRSHPEIYTTLHENTVWLRERLKSVAERRGIPFQINGNYSIFSMTFSYREPKLVRDSQAGANYRANVALAYYLRKRGIYIPELHAMMLSAAHTGNDLAAVAGAFDLSLEEMTSDGFFTL